MSIYQIWIPGEKGYKEHLDRKTFSNDQVSAIREQTTQLKNAYRQPPTQHNEQIQELIASNGQIFTALDEGFNRIANINIDS